MALQDYLTDIKSATAPAQQEYDAATQKLAETKEGQSTVAFKLKEALNKKLNYNQDLILQQNQAMKDYFVAPATAREKYQNVFNPFTKEKLVAESTGQALQEYSNVGDLLTQRMGQVSDVVGEGVAGYQGVVGAAQTLADAASSKYQNAFREYQQAAQMQQEADAQAFREKQLQQSYDLAMLPYEQMTAYQRAQLAQSGSSGLGVSAGLQNNIVADIKGRMTPKDLFAKYGDSVDFSTLTTLYNQNSPWGPAKESMQDLRTMYDSLGGANAAAVNSYVDRIVAGDMNISNVPPAERNAVVTAMANKPITDEQKQTINSIKTQLGQFKELINPSKFLGIVPRSPKEAEINTAAGLLGMEIARLYEKGRLSDADREFYVGKLPIAGEPNSTSLQKLRSIESSLSAKFGTDWTEGGEDDPMGIR